MPCHVVAVFSPFGLSMLHTSICCIGGFDCLASYVALSAGLCGFLSLCVPCSPFWSPLITPQTGVHMSVVA